MRTTIDLPDPLFRSARAAALEQGVTLKEFFTEALDRALRAPKAVPQRMDHPPITRSAGSTSIPARTNRELAEIFGEEDLSKAR
jgi:hypothetical protein